MRAFTECQFLLLLVSLKNKRLSGFTVAPNNNGIQYSNKLLLTATIDTNAEEQPVKQFQDETYGTEVAKILLDFETQKVQVESLQKDLQTALSKITDLEVREAKLVDDISKLESTVSQTEDKVVESQNKLTDTNDKLTQALQVSSDLKELLTRSEEKYKETESDLVDANDKIQQQKATIEDLENKLRSIKLNTSKDDEGKIMNPAEVQRTTDDRKKAEVLAYEKQQLLAQKKAEAEEKKKRAKEALEAKKVEAEQKRIEAIEKRKLAIEEKKKRAQEALALRKAEAERKRIEAMEKRKQAEEERQRRIAAKNEEAARKKQELAQKRADAEERKRQALEEKKEAAATTKGADGGIPVINKWELTSDGEVKGIVTGHPVIKDGDVILTSSLANPSEAFEQRIVLTESGSKYQLGSPSKTFSSSYRQSAASTNERDKTSTTEEEDIELVFQSASEELDLTGTTIGNDRNYFLAGRPITTTSGRSQLWTAYRSDKKGLPIGDALAVKISSLCDAMERDYMNYNKVKKSNFFTRGEFCRQWDFIPNAFGGDDCALVMDRGAEDLKSFVARQEEGGLKGRDLRIAAVSAVKCMDAMHSSGLVWTDLKSENFVCFDREGDNNLAVKGIDLESAMPVTSNPVDYSPEACPPEFASAYFKGDAPDFILDYSYDVWSFGMLLYELSTGRDYFTTRRDYNGKNSNPTPAMIMRMLPDIEPEIYDVPDEKMRDLISRCLSVEPKKRPTVAQILLHPYFLTTGVGPFSFL